MRRLCHGIASALLYLGQPLPCAQETPPNAESQPQEKHLNRLAKETSPYLLQHQHNPVDWYPWGEEALQRAKEEDKVIFLSIGYSACHWCHVMERESFENPKIAALMNEYFVCIKVDREERPDIDEIYMASVQAMTGQGGWPMSVWMTPDLQPFFAGTYYPPEDKMGMPGFPKVLEHVHGLWRDRREEVQSRSKEIAEYLRKTLAAEAAAGEPALSSQDTFAQQSLGRFDEEFGGFGNAPAYAPKFPHASELSMLLRYAARTGDEKSLAAAEHSLERMAGGGIYDQLAGGFHRYSTDREWLAPHFEKMLYDNSLLAQAYADAYLLTGKPLYARILRETLDYMLREMRNADGGFYSTQDADSEGVEGKFFVWTEEEVQGILAEDAPLFAAAYDVTGSGNWEGHNILRRVLTDQELAEKFELEPSAVEAVLAAGRAKLLAARLQRIPPGTDDKVLTAWNGMAIAACARGYQVLGDEKYLDAGRRAAEFIFRELWSDGRLLRTWREGKAHLNAYLEDYAFVADALISLFECDFDPRWLERTGKLLAIMEDQFRDDSDGSFFFTGDDHEALIARSKAVSESSIPSGIAMATIAFLRAGLITGNERLYQVGYDCLRANNKFLETFPIAGPGVMLAADFALADPRELVIAGEPGDPGVIAFLEAARNQFPNRHVVTLVHASNREELSKLVSILEGKEPIEGRPAAYLCRRGVCEAPVTDAQRIQWR
ncbi:MAG: thioredoxin domain-containing protein [Planctomycetota bacterium]|jgi:uncharacterized protein YyaL (SSP411 family)